MRRLLCQPAPERVQTGRAPAKLVGSKLPAFSFRRMNASRERERERDKLAPLFETCREIFHLHPSRCGRGRKFCPQVFPPQSLRFTARPARQSDVADFDGRSSLLYRFSQKTVSTVKDTISLQFRSPESEGVILHGEGQRGDYITLELSKGKVSLQLNLAGASLGLTPAPVVLGSLLDDQHWHYITIERNKNRVNFTVDKDVRHFYTEGDLSFGGISVPGKSKTFLRKNFRGCLENIYYNWVNIIDLAKRHKPQIDVLVRARYT
uniref:Contactin-associated protein-like 5 n=1 Tax=Callorhinchus milii TaxID=7868 RepID=A0A4W3GJV6_CALMI